MGGESMVGELAEGTILEGPHWTEPVKVLTAKPRGSHIEVQAVGMYTKRLWTKLLRPEEFDVTIKVTQPGQLAALNGIPTHFRLAAEAHRIRLAFQYTPHFAVSVSQVDPLAEIEQEQHLSEKPPEILGVAVILPAPQEVVRSVERMESDPEVERITVDLVMKYDHEQGRKPVSVEVENCGWDVTSLTGGQGERYIEVKGRAGEGGVALTPNEWIKAQRFGKEYWLYVVVNCKTNPQLYLIQDPASKLNPRMRSVSSGTWSARAIGRPPRNRQPQRAQRS